MQRDSGNSDGEAKPTPAEVAPPHSPNEWFELLYQELRRRARGELFRHQALTLGATTLLHEAWMQLDARALHFATQAELVVYAARTMRGIVIDHIRARHADKRGGHAEHQSLDTWVESCAVPDPEVLRIHEALAALESADPRLAELVELKFFAGLNFAEVAALRQVSERTVQRDWEKARLFLFASIRE